MMTVQLRRYALSLLALPFILTACDSGSSEPGDDIAPTATSATATGETLTITFDEPVDAASVRASAFTVMDEGQSLPVAGAEADGSTVTVTLADPFALFPTRSIEVMIDGVRDEAGNAVDAGSATFDYGRNGQGSANVSGAVVGSVTDGFTFFTVDVVEGRETFVLFVADVMPEDIYDSEFVFIAAPGARPPSGNFSIGSDLNVGPIGAYLNYESQTDQSVVLSESGILTISSSTPEVLTGNYSFTGPAGTTSGGTTGTAAVSGSFEAIYVDPDLIDLDAARGTVTAARLAH